MNINAAMLAQHDKIADKLASMHSSQTDIAEKLRDPKATNEELQISGTFILAVVGLCHSVQDDCIELARMIFEAVDRG